MDILFKNSKALVKDVDTKGRTVTGYFSTWGYDSNGAPVPDSDGDVIMRGAFEKTLSMNGPATGNRIWHLQNHMTSLPIAKPKVMKEDETGLYFETVFPDTTIANDLLKLYEAGHLTEHSIGYNVVQARNENDFTLLQEIRLWEGSSVLWGANQNTPTTGIKAEEAKLQMDILEGLLHNGTLSDETFIKIEQLLNDLKLIFNANKPVESGKTDNDEGEIKKEAINIITNFKFNLYGKP